MYECTNNMALESSLPIFWSARGVLTTPSDEIYHKYDAAIPFGEGYSQYWVCISLSLQLKCCSWFPLA